MGLKAIYCTNDVLEPTMAMPGERASASSDFSGKDLLTYTAITAAIAAVSGCISSTVTETDKTEVQHSASEGERKQTPDVTTTTTASTVAAYDPATFEVPKEHEPLPRTQIDHLFATPGDVVGVSATRRDGVAGQIEFWVVYEGINKVDGETVKGMVADNGKGKEIDMPRYVANFDVWEYSTVSNKVVGPIHRTLEADPHVFDRHYTHIGSSEGRTGFSVTLDAIYSGNNKDVAATCNFLAPLDEEARDINPNDGKLDGCFVTDGKSMESLLSLYISKGSAIKEKDLSADEKIFLNNVKTMMKYDSENPQGYAIVSIGAYAPCLSQSGNC